MARVSLRDVKKTFDDDGDEVVAVDNLNLEIQDGEFLVLVGPSGCGKSTTLRMVAGLETPTSGEIRLGDNLINDLRPQDRNIAMVFQSYALYPHMTVRENMSFGLRQSTDLSDDVIDQEVVEAGEMLGIENLLNRVPGDLSGGQQQRVALGRAIVRDPEVFLLDEPLSNLDAKLRAEMRTELQRIQEELDVTTMYVTHDQTEAMTMGDRIAILNDGKLQQVGTPIESYHQPKNIFVAGFIGEPSMNFFDTSYEDEKTLVSEHFDYPLSADVRSDLGDSIDITLGIRPENIAIDDDHDDEHTYPAVVDVVEPQGNENTVHLRFADQAEHAETFTATVDGMRHLEAGQRVSVTFPEDAIHLFDANTGTALHNRKIDAPEATEQTSPA